MARRQGLSESAVVDQILKDYIARHKGFKSDLDNVKIGHLMDAVAAAKKRKK